VLALYNTSVGTKGGCWEAAVREWQNCGASGVIKARFRPFTPTPSPTLYPFKLLLLQAAANSTTQKKRFYNDDDYVQVTSQWL
jgi:hypothetical protein